MEKRRYRKFTLRADVREGLSESIEALATSLVADKDLDRDDAGEVIGLMVEAFSKVALDDHRSADLISSGAEWLADKIQDLLLTDPSDLLDRAGAALKAGHPKKAKRLFAKAERVLARQGGDDDA